jgi:hypothetical protein
MKSRWMKLAQHIAHMREKRNGYRILLENQETRDHLEELDVGWGILLRWILER